MKKLILILGLLSAPFIAVWTIWLLTFFNFSPFAVFDNSMFWGVCLLWWFLCSVLVPMVIDMKDQPEPSKTQQLHLDSFEYIRRAVDCNEKEIKAYIDRTYPGGADTQTVLFIEHSLRVRLVEYLETHLKSHEMSVADRVLGAIQDVKRSYNKS